VFLLSDIVKIQLVDRKNEIFMPIHITQQTKQIGRQYTDIKQGAGLLLKGMPEASYKGRNNRLRTLDGYI
jgi:hypothetical protein